MAAPATEQSGMVPAIKAGDEELRARIAIMQAQLASMQSASAQHPTSEHEAIKTALQTEKRRWLEEAAAAEQTKRDEATRATREAAVSAQLALSAAVREAEARAATALETALETEKRRWSEEHHNITSLVTSLVTNQLVSNQN